MISSLIDRDEILKAARKLPHGSIVSIFPDLPPEISDLRSNDQTNALCFPKMAGG